MSPNLTQIPLLSVGHEFTLKTDERDLDEKNNERVTPAGSVWTVVELEPNLDPVMQYSVVCAKTGGWIHLTHAELAQSGYAPAIGTPGSNLDNAAPLKYIEVQVPAWFDDDKHTIFDALEAGAAVSKSYTKPVAA